MSFVEYTLKNEISLILYHNVLKVNYVIAQLLKIFNEYSFVIITQDPKPDDTNFGTRLSAELFMNYNDKYLIDSFLNSETLVIFDNAELLLESNNYRLIENKGTKSLVLILAKEGLTMQQFQILDRNNIFNFYPELYSPTINNKTEFTKYISDQEEICPFNDQFGNLTPKMQNILELLKEPGRHFLFYANYEGCLSLSSILGVAGLTYILLSEHDSPKIQLEKIVNFNNRESRILISTVIPNGLLDNISYVHFTHNFTIDDYYDILNIVYKIDAECILKKSLGNKVLNPVLPKICSKKEIVFYYHLMRITTENDTFILTTDIYDYEIFIKELEQRQAVYDSYITKSISIL